ncbi:hypothetical protein BGZ63DRAFT_132111 [Mariannaea sp. PMI_226]|nr:hypothetical protein BGZ63DRAFT_132111 [Mariannaea sp. PMI_226]
MHRKNCLPTNRAECLSNNNGMAYSIRSGQNCNYVGTREYIAWNALSPASLRCLSLAPRMNFLSVLSIGTTLRPATFHFFMTTQQDTNVSMFATAISCESSRKRPIVTTRLKAHVGWTDHGSLLHCTTKACLCPPPRMHLMAYDMALLLRLRWTMDRDVNRNLEPRF